MSDERPDLSVTLSLDAWIEMTRRLVEAEREAEGAQANHACAVRHLYEATGILRWIRGLLTPEYNTCDSEATPIIDRINAYLQDDA